MADDPVAVVRGAYEAFGRGDVPAVLAAIDPEVVWVESEATAIPTRGTHRGPDAVAEKVFGAVPANFASFEIVPEDFFRDGDTVIVRGVVRATAKTSGKTMNAPFVHVFTIKGGKVTKLTNHHDTAVWVETLAP